VPVPARARPSPREPSAPEWEVKRLIAAERQIVSGSAKASHHDQLAALAQRSRSR
jgi:hypothetical protein